MPKRFPEQAHRCVWTLGLLHLLLFKLMKQKYPTLAVKTLNILKNII